MSTNSERPGSPQGASPVPNLTEALFGPYIGKAWVTAAAAGDAGSWTGAHYRADRVAAFDPMRGHYFSIALMKAGSTTRCNENFFGGRVIVADDVGSITPDGAIPFTPGAEVDAGLFDMSAPETSYEVETSLGNFQKGYVIDPPERDLARWMHFLDLMKRHPRFGPAFRKCTPVHYVRMETGRNQPKPNRPRFASKLAKPFTGLTYTLDELAAGFGIDMTTPAAKNPRSPAAAGETLSPDALRKLTTMIPNDDNYDTWIRVGHALYGASEGSEEGRDVFMEWSAQSQKHDLMQSTSETWDTLFAAKASATTLRRIIEDLHGPQSKEREAASQIFAGGGVFGVLEEEAIPMPEETATKKADRKFATLLKEIAKTQPIPDHHKANGKAHDEHWLPTGGGLLDIGTLTGTALPVAPPVIYEPFVRGGLSVIGGAPSIGKSNLMLDQSLAVIADRGDLLRNGGRLQFAGDVIYVSNEDDLSVLQRRAIAWSKHHGVDLTKTPYRLIPVRTTLFRKAGDETWHADCIPVLERILEHGKTGRRIAMVIIDTLGTSVTGIDEAQIRDISPAMKLFRDLAAALWCAVAFLHHTTKEAWARGTADTTLRSIATIRGSGGITGTYTRGATLIVAPDKKELEAHPNWGNMDIVVEFLAKANDGRENFVACYYQRVLVDVEQVSAVDPLIREFRKEPVLVPFRVTPFADDLAQLDDYLATIKAWPEPVQVVEKIANTGSPNSVQKVLGVSNQAAKTIVEALVATQKVELENTINNKGRVHKVLKIN